MKIVIKDLLEKMSDLNECMFQGRFGSPNAEWYEKKIFNETRLYEALGKEDARSVLSIWRRYKQTIELLRDIEKLMGDK